MCLCVCTDICVFLNHSQLLFICLWGRVPHWTWHYLIQQNYLVSRHRDCPASASPVLWPQWAQWATPGFHLVLGTKIRSLYLHSNTVLTKPSSQLLFCFFDTWPCFVAQVHLELFAQVVFDLLSASVTGTHHPMKTVIWVKHVWSYVIYSVLTDK